MQSKIELMVEYNYYSNVRRDLIYHNSCNPKIKIIDVKLKDIMEKICEIENFKENKNE